MYQLYHVLYPPTPPYLILKTSINLRFRSSCSHPKCIWGEPFPPFLHGSHYQVAFPCPGPRISLDALRSRPPRRETALAVEHVGWARFEGKKDLALRHHAHFMNHISIHFPRENRVLLQCLMVFKGFCGLGVMVASYFCHSRLAWPVRLM